MTTGPSGMPRTELPLTSLSGDQLRARMAQAHLYLIHMEPVEGAPSSLPQELHHQHLAYLDRLTQAARLYGAGPLETPGNNWPADGRVSENGGALSPVLRGASDLAIIAAASREGAEAIAKQDPLAKAGLRRNQVTEHIMNEGVACYVGRAMARRVAEEADGFDPAAPLGKKLRNPVILNAQGARAYLCLIHLIPTDKPRPAEDVQTAYDHFVWLRTHEMAAKLMSCGPVEPPAPLAPGIWGGGLAVVSAPPAEAKAIAAAEPSGLAGYRRLVVQGWRMDYGVAAPIAQALQTLNWVPKRRR